MPSTPKSENAKPATTDAVVLLDTYRWTDENGAVQEAAKGDKVSVSQAEYDRAQSMVPRALADSSEENPSNEVAIPKDLSELSDDELRTLAVRLGGEVTDDTTRDELVGIVAASPGGNERPNQ